MILLDLFEAIKNRRSIRAYRPDTIPEEDLKKILEAATLAPSAGNLQPWEFIIIRNSDRRRRIAKAAYGQTFIAEAPVVIVVCANLDRTAWRYGRRGETLYCIQDTAAAIMNMMLAAYALGYGTCWVGAFDEEKVSRIIEAPDRVRPVAIIPLGVPAESPRMPSRLPLSEVVHLEKYGAKWK